MEVSPTVLVIHHLVTILVHRLFDHYAHLGGAAFGAMYYYYGLEWWSTVKRVVGGTPQTD